MTVIQDRGLHSLLSHQDCSLDNIAIASQGGSVQRRNSYSTIQEREHAANFCRNLFYRWQTQQFECIGKTLHWLQSSRRTFSSALTLSLINLECSRINVTTRQIHEFAVSRLGEEIFGPIYSRVRTSIDPDNSIIFYKIVHTATKTLLRQNASFKWHWEKNPEARREVILGTLVETVPHLYMENLSASDNEFKSIKKVQQFLQSIIVASRYRQLTAQQYYSLAVLFFKYHRDVPFASLHLWLDNFFHFIASSPIPNKEEKCRSCIDILFSTENYNFSQLLKDSHTLEKMTINPILLPEIIPVSLRRFSSKLLETYDFSPSLFLRFISPQLPFSIAKCLIYVIPFFTLSQMRLLFDLIDRFPNDAPFAIENLLEESTRLLQPGLIRRAMPVLEWISLQADQEQMIALLDKLTALFLDNRSLFNRLLSIPKEKVHLWQTILKGKENIPDIKEGDVKATLKEVNETKLAYDIFCDKSTPLSMETIESFVKRVPEAKSSFIGWINQILIDRGGNRKDINEMALSKKIDNLTQNDCEIINDIITIEGRNLSWIKPVFLCGYRFPSPFIVKRIFKAARALFCPPFTELTSKETTGLHLAITSFNELGSRYPSLFPHFLTLLEVNPRILANLDILGKCMTTFTFSHLISHYIVDTKQKKNSKTYKEHIFTTKHTEQLLADSVLCTYFIELLQYEILSGLSIFPRIAEDLTILNRTRPRTNNSSLLCAIKEFAALGCCIASLPWKIAGYVALLDKYEKDPSFLYNWLQLAGNYPKAAQWLLTDGSNHYDVLITHATSDLPCVQNILRLVEQGKEDFVDLWIEELLLYPKILQMAQITPLSDVEGLLHWISKEKDPFSLRVLDAIGTIQEPLAMAVVRLHKEAPNHLLLSFMRTQEKGVLTFTFLEEQLVLLACRGQQDLLEFAIHIASIADGTHDTYANMAVNMITQGYYSLARDMIRHENWTLRAAFLPITDIKQQKQLYDLFNSLRQIESELSEHNQHPIDLVRADTKEFFSMCVLLFQSVSDKQAAMDWIAKTQFNFLRKPEALFELTKSAQWRMFAISAKTSPNKVSRLLTLFPNDEATSIFYHSVSDFIGDTPTHSTRWYTRQSLIIAHYLLTPGGALNIPFMKLLTRPPSPYPTESYEEKYLDFVWQMLIENHDISEQIEQIHTPPEANTIQSSTIRTLMDIPHENNISVRDARVMALSTLLCPIRQTSGIGSCFATAPLAALNTYLMGIKQALEDYISLVINGYIERPSTKNPKILIKYRMAGVQIPEDEHPFVKEREFIVASMPREESNRHENTIQKWLDLIKEKVFPFSEPHAGLTNLIETNLKQALLDLSSETFLTSTSNSDSSFSGAWVIIDKENHLPLSQINTFQNFFQKVFSRVEKAAKEGYPHLEIPLKALFATTLPKYVLSQEFLLAFFDKTTAPHNLNKGLAKVNPAKYFHVLANSPLSSTSGGDASQVLRAYCGRQVYVRCLPARKYSIESIFVYISTLPWNEKIHNILHQHRLKVVNETNHAFGLHIGKLTPFIYNGQSKEWLKRITKTTKSISNEALNPEIQQKILDAYFEINTLCLPWKHQITKKAKGCTTVGTLCRLLIEQQGLIIGKHKEIRDTKRQLTTTIQTIPQLKAIIGDHFIVGDTNWRTDDSFGYTIDCVEQKEEGWTFTNPSSIANVNWSTDHASHWRIHEWEPYTVYSIHYARLASTP